MNEEVAIIGESRGGIDKEMGDEERNEEENDGKEGIKLEMEGEIWIVEEKKMGTMIGEDG